MFTAGGATNVTAPTAANAQVPARLQNRVGWSSRPIALQVQRDAAAAADAMAADLYFYGLMVLKAS
ncbi:hypothetical protein [Rhodococcus cercidiphylli]|uniref:Uncharacterized protein n=1 Tax=Rhodococcus cercidiphylli TaxID=489916 RepID=A0ABU4B3V8_9NOCA|nr:hypothetical protein [Rhodococcus cercidiphylli]MDV6233161.1 hypothetical protein [Rhodococcus cercidiphylli]